MNTIQRREFETILRKLNAAEKIVERINSPDKILTSRLSLKDCNYNLVNKFIIRKSEMCNTGKCDAKRK